MPDAFVTKDTGYRLGGDSRAGFRRPADQSRVWFNDNEFTQVSVTDPPNPLGLSRRMKVTFADAELEAKEGLYEIGTVATVRVQLSRYRNKESTVVIPITVTRHGTTTAADYAGAGIPSSITFLPGQTEYSFRVRAVNDDIDDDDEYLTLSFGTAARTGRLRRPGERPDRPRRRRRPPGAGVLRTGQLRSDQASEPAGVGTPNTPG